MHTAEPHRRQIICQLPADPRGLTITQQKRYCSRCPYANSAGVEKAMDMTQLIQVVMFTAALAIVLLCKAAPRLIPHSKIF